MRKRLFVMINILVLLTGILNPSIAYAKTNFREASIVDFSGTVKVIISGGQKEYKAYKGMGLTQGDTVITSEKSSVNLYIDDDKEIILGENSKLTLSELSNYLDSQSKSTGLKLWAGKLFATVKKKLNIRSKFEITTGSTVMGVKGTEFFVSYLPVDSSVDGVQDMTQSLALRPNQRRHKMDLMVLSGSVSASFLAPPSGSNAAQQRSTINVKAKQRLEFMDDERDQGQKPTVRTLTQQDLDLLVLEKIKENPDNYDNDLKKDLDKLIKEKREQEEQKRKQKEEEYRQQLEAKRKQEQGRRQQYTNPTPTPATPSSTPTPTPAISQGATPGGNPAPSASPTPSSAPVRGPELLEGSYMPMELYPNTPDQTNPKEAVFIFSKRIASVSVPIVETSIRDAVLVGPEEMEEPISADDSVLEFAWNENCTVLTVTVSAESSLPVYFKNVRNIDTYVMDVNGNGNTVVLHELDTVEENAYCPTVVQVERVPEIDPPLYYTSTRDYTVYLPEGVNLTEFYGLIENFSDYFAFGGALDGVTVKEFGNEGFINERQVIYITLEGDESGDIRYVGTGPATIIVSNRLLVDGDGEMYSKPICASVELSEDAFVMEPRLEVVEGLADPSVIELLWDDTEGEVDSLEISQISEDPEDPSDWIRLFDYEEAPGTSIFMYREDRDANGYVDLAHISGLDTGRTYKIRGFISYGDHTGYTKVTTYTPIVVDDENINIFQTLHKNLPTDLENPSINVGNPTVADVTWYNYNEYRDKLAIRGKRPGVTRVVVSGTYNNVYISYSFKVTVEDIDMGSAIVPSTVTPEGIDVDYIDIDEDHFINVTYDKEIIIKLPGGMTFKNLDNVDAASYVWFGRDNKEVAISRIENVSGASNTVKITLATDGIIDDKEYIQIYKMGYYDLLISGSLLDSETDPTAIIYVQIMVGGI